MEAEVFDEDIADEDFLKAFDQVSSSDGKQLVPSPLSIGANRQTKLEASRPASSAQCATEAYAPGGRKRTPPAVRTGLNRVNSSSFRQTTLWGTEATQKSTQQSQSASARIYKVDVPREEPSHHGLDSEAMKTWVYPTNLGAIRDYQFSIVKSSLFNNTLVALPTGLGKTFIAATVMLNFYRWTRTAKIVFVAPTKPLVAQQVDACYNIVGIPRSETTLLTGNIPPALRVDEWETRRVFFMTPQTLLNDLSHGYADPKSIALIVIDEAHRAVGEYAYAKVTEFIRRFSKSFRVLALTATPGSKVETVQEVIDNLGISHCEIRTEESIDIRQYVHQRSVDLVVLDPSDEMNLVSELFTEALKPLVDKLSSQNIFYGRNPMALTTYGLMQAQREWFATRGRHVSQGVQFMMRAIFGVLTGLAHSIKLLNFHGIKPFYDNLVDFRSEQEGKGEKGSKYKRQLIEHPSFQGMMDKISTWLKLDGFVGHPKLTALADCVLNHFMDRGEGSPTRVIVFSEYRDSAEDIVRALNKHRPLIKASVFVGQADGKRGEGMKQAQQIQTIEMFKKGAFNVLVATSIGEEGLDIGEVDLIVCYDASASPIRMLQRMGRTGRKREGKITLLLMRGKEEDQFAKSKDNYEKMQQLICDGSRFNFRFDQSTRIVPREIRPEVDRRHVDIPVENTQDASLPEPSKRRVPRGKKKPPKKFHMPDGVETGFQKATQFMKPVHKAGRANRRRNPELDDLAEVPDLKAVVLSAEDVQELDRSYRDLPFNHSVVEETDMPSLTSHPRLQRQLQPVANVKHGVHTRRCVKVLGQMGSNPDSLVRPCREVDGSNYREIPVRPFVNSDGEEEMDDTSKPTNTSKKQATGWGPVVGDMGDESRRKRRKTSKFEAALGIEERNTEREGEEEGGGNRVARKRRVPRDKRRKTARVTGGDEVGDDCERDSDLMETSGSDDGADLLDFVVADNQTSWSMLSSQATPPTLATRQSTPDNRTEKPFFIRTQFSATQESEDIPDLKALMGTKRTSRQGDSDDESEAKLGDFAARRAARGRRRLVDSDSDE